MNSSPAFAAKSVKYFIVSVEKLDLPSAPALPLHQSHAARPARIHDVSVIADAGLKFRIAFDSISLPGASAISSTRHADRYGSPPATATLSSSNRGASFDSSRCASSPHPLDGFTRYIAAVPRKSASVIAIHATPGSSINSGSPTIFGTVARLLNGSFTYSLSYADRKFGSASA